MILSLLNFGLIGQIKNLLPIASNLLLESRLLHGLVQGNGPIVLSSSLLAIAIVLLLRRRHSVEGLCLKVEELEVVRALVPLVLLVVVARAWLTNILLVDIKAIGNAKV